MLYHDEQPEVIRQHYQQDDGHHTINLRRLAFFGGLIIICLFVGLSWYAYQEGKGSTLPEDAPLVKAPEEPFRVKPENPGGMEIPHRDKTIYQAMDDDPSADLPRVEALLPEPEEPVQVEKADRKLIESRMDVMKQRDEKPRKVEKILDDTTARERQKKASPELRAVMESLKPALATDVGSASEPAVTVGAKNVPTTKPAAEAVAEAKTAVKPPLPVDALKPQPKAPDSVAPSVPVQAPKPSAPLPPASMVKTSTPEEAKATPGHRVQLGAFRSREDALDAWNKAQARHKILTDKQYTVERADLGAKGIFFRLQVVPMKSEGEAKSVCEQLSAQKQGCFVVKR